MLCTERGSIRVTRAELEGIEPPESTATWKPVKHATLISALTAAITNTQRYIIKEEFAIQRDGKKLFGVMDLKWGETMEYRAALGFRTSNDKSLAIQMVAGARVFVCDNLVLAGESIVLKRKHTSQLDLEEELREAVQRYELGSQQLQRGIEHMKNQYLSLSEVRAFICQAFAQKVVPLRIFPAVTAPYMDDTGAAQLEYLNKWELHNAFTTPMKALKPNIRFEATQRLGKFFELTGEYHDAIESSREARSTGNDSTGLGNGSALPRGLDYPAPYAGATNL